MDGRARLLDTRRFGKGLFDAPYSTRVIGFKLAIVRTRAFASIRRGFKSERYSTALIRRTSNWLQSDGQSEAKGDNERRGCVDQLTWAVHKNNERISADKCKTSLGWLPQMIHFT